MCCIINEKKRIFSIGGTEAKTLIDFTDKTTFFDSFSDSFSLICRINLPQSSRIEEVFWFQPTWQISRLESAARHT